MFVRVCTNMPPVTRSTSSSTSNIDALHALFQRLQINQEPAIPFNAVAVFTTNPEETETNETEDPPIPSYQSVWSIKTTPQSRKAVTFDTSKRWLTAWLRHTDRYRCHATATQFHPDCPSKIQFAHIHLPRSVQSKEWADKVVSCISYSVSCLSVIPDCSVRICARYEIQDLGDS